MISKKDLNSAELETVTTSRSPTTGITSNGEVQTNEEARVYVRELGFFLTMKVIEDAPAVLSLGKLCDVHGYSFEWINGQKQHLITNGIQHQCNTENFLPIVASGLSTSSSSSLPTSTPTTPSKEIDHSDQPPAIVSSEHVDRQVRWDRYSGTDHHPAIVSSERADWLVRWDPYLGTDHHPSSESVDGQVWGDPYSSENIRSVVKTK